jgi:hypothetical protein
MKPDCGEAGGGFVLDPENHLLGYQVSDFVKTSELDQTRWALRLTKAYYGQVCAYPDKSVVTGYSGGNPVRHLRAPRQRAR